MELNLDGHVKRVHTVNNQFQDIGNKHKAVVHLVKICNSCKKGYVFTAIRLETTTHVPKIEVSEYEA